MKQKKTTKTDPHKPLKTAEFKRMKKWNGFDAMPNDMKRAIQRSVGRPKSESPKEHINIRLDADLVTKLRDSGPGWQTRLNGVVREWLGA